MFFLTISPTSVISSDPNNFFSTTIKLAIDQLSYHGFQFLIWDIRISQEIKCGIEIALFLEFNFLCLDNTLTALNWSEYFHTSILLGFEVIIFD